MSADYYKFMKKIKAFAKNTMQLKEAFRHTHHVQKAWTTPQKTVKISMSLTNCVMLLL